jgi:hypothetical protein
VAIGPFLQDLLHPLVRGVQGDVAVTMSVQDVDRGVDVGVQHDPVVTVKLLPAPDSEESGVVVHL